MRPAGPVRRALMDALHAGARGTFDTLAQHANVPAHRARQTLANMRREGVVAKATVSPSHAPQRARAVYVLAAEEGEGAGRHVLDFARGVWR